MMSAMDTINPEKSILTLIDNPYRMIIVDLTYSIGRSYTKYRCILMRIKVPIDTRMRRSSVIKVWISSKLI